MTFVLQARWRVSDNRFREYKRKIHQSSERAAVRAQNQMVRKAREVASERRRTGKMEAGIVGRVELTERGVLVAVEDRVWYAHFQDRGTKRGVTPLLFLEAGLAEGKTGILADIEIEAKAPI